jgi:peptidyl-prolyl cis-trans isomerase B (cyclophilin B)
MRKVVLWIAAVAVVGLAVYFIVRPDGTPRTEPETKPETKPETEQTMQTFAIIETEKGTMKAELYTDATPGTTENFIKLAESGFYDGLTFHRVIPDFVIQGGCPEGTGRGGPGYTIPCETSAERQYHDRGVLSMAHAGTNTGGSQFFICHGREGTKHLDGRHTCFGKVVEGIEVVDKISMGDRILSISIVRE